MSAQGAAKRIAARARMTAAAAAKQRHSLSSLIEQIVARREQSALLTYWLLDRSALPQGRWLKDWSAGDAAVDLLTGRRSIEPDGVTPVLIHARSLHASPARAQRKLDELMNVAAVSNTVGLLRSTLTLEVLQVALQARTRVVLPQGLQAVLRYFDTRALPLLPRLLTPAQYARARQRVALSGPMGAVAAVARAGSYRGKYAAAPTRRSGTR